MSLDHEIPELDRKGLRQFGFVTGGIVVVLFGGVFPWLLSRPWPVWPWIVLGLLAAPALIAPNALRPIYRGWMRFGLLASRVTTPLVLGIVFYLVISPMALFFRLLGRDTMARSTDEGQKSYRVPSNSQSPENLENPY